MLTPPQEPMLARAATALPEAAARYAYEPKFDGFRALLFVNDTGCFLQSRRGTPLGDCFPEIIQTAAVQVPAGTVVDGELVIWSSDGSSGHLDFPALQRRVASPTRAATMAAEQPASFMAFDVLAAAGEDVRKHPLSQRRSILEALAGTWTPPLHLTPQTSDRTIAERWLRDYAQVPVGVEGIMIKPVADLYRPGKRGWQKLRIRHTAEAIVGAVTGPVDAPVRLVLALPGRDGRLLVAGATAALTRPESAAVARRLSPGGADHPWPAELAGARLGSFGGDKIAVTRVDPHLVVEVETDTSFEFGGGIRRGSSDCAPTYWPNT